MKRILLLIGLFVIAQGYSQQKTYLLTFDPMTDASTGISWDVFEGDTPGEEFLANPAPVGANTDPGNVMLLKVLQTNVCYAGAIIKPGNMGVWQLEAPITTTLSMQVYKTTIGRIGVKMVNATNGTIFELTSQTNTVLNQWETLTWDISPFITSGDNMNINQLVIFSDFTCGDPDRLSGSDTYIDNITWGANSLSTPSCTDGIQNSDETGIDCGGLVCPDCVVDGPLVDAPIPPARNADDVISIYGESYATLAGINYNPFWGQSGLVEINYDIDDPSNASMAYTNFNYQGTELAAAVDASAMSFLHIDIWTKKATDVKVSPINIGGTGGAEFLVNVPLIEGEWSSVDLAKSDFAGMSWDAILQLKFDGQAGVSPSDIYLDNIYFYKGFPLSTGNLTDGKSMTIYPNPVSNTFNISNIKGIKTVTIFDMYGRAMLTKQFSTGQTDVNVSSLIPGVYMAKVETESGSTQTQSFIVK